MNRQNAKTLSSRTYRRDLAYQIREALEDRADADEAADVELLSVFVGDHGDAIIKIRCDALQLLESLKEDEKEALNG